MPCLLGFEDEPIDKEATDFTVNKVGGTPDWASGQHINPQCRTCRKSMLLAVQIYAPLDGSRNHRSLYLFCCVSQKCHTQNGGWVCLRDETLDTSTNSTQAAMSPPVPSAPSASTWIEDADDWGDGADDWGEIDNTKKGEKAAMDVFEASVEKLNINGEAHRHVSESSEEGPTSPEIQPVAADPVAEVEEMDASVVLDEVAIKPNVNLRSLFTPSEATVEETSSLVFHSFYLSVSDEEPSKASVTAKLDQRAKQLMQEYQKREKCDWTKEKAGGKHGASEETYEKSRPNHGDEIVHKFISRVQTNPEQLIRYEREGAPLLYKPLGKLRETCKHCGSAFVFELQLMPHLSQKLSLSLQVEIDCPVEISTVLIFTCAKSCWSGELSEEFVIVQSEIY